MKQAAREATEAVTGLPLCTAPFTSVVVDTHKGVRPCCTWDDAYFGNLRSEGLAGILQGPAWTALKEAHLRGEWPRGCINCLERERETGWSLRQSYLDRRASLQGAEGCYFSRDWRQGLTYLELNTTNLCNLACIHCTGAFSSRWLAEERRLEAAGVHFQGHGTANGDGLRFQTHELHLPDRGLLLDNLARVDLGRLRYLNVKGGEPMLNRDVPAVLAFLADRGVLPGVEVHVSTNGTRVQEEALALLRDARRVRVWFSVDGTGKVQEYIRRGRSSIRVVEGTLRKWTGLANAEFGLCTSVMPYNVFSLDRVLAWWESLPESFPSHRFLETRFSLMITVPAHLSLRCLQDATRARLMDFYRRSSGPGGRPRRGAGRGGWLERIARAAGRGRRGGPNGPYADVIQALAQPYAGHELHNRFVEYTLRMDACRNTRVLDAVPELKEEMVRL